jgi:hypothetical protein
LHAPRPPESWIIARSTAQVTISPGVTRSRPAARAMIFSANVHCQSLIS